MMVIMSLLHVIKYADALNKPLMVYMLVPAYIFDAHEEWLDDRWVNIYGNHDADDGGKQWNAEDNIQLARNHLQELLLNYNGDES